MFKKYLKCYGILYLLIIILTLITSIINYFFILPNSLINIIIPLIGIIISSFILGINSQKKAYIEGLKFISIYILISLFLSLFIFKNTFSYKSLIIYLIFILSSMLSSMIGINKKKK